MTNDIKIFFGVIAATLVIVLASAFIFGRTGSVPSSNGQSTKPVVVDPKILVRDNSWSEGSPSARVTVVEFGDYQCPACKATEAATEELRMKYKDKVRFVWRNFPLTQTHKYAFNSALAAEAAGLQGVFWQYHKRLFEASPELPKEKLFQIAKDMNLDMEKFEKDFNSDPVRQRVLDDQADGNRAGVNGTPTYFIGNEKLVMNRLPDLSDFQSKIDPLLK